MKKGEIWLLDFPSRGGHEQRGTRPALLIANTGTDLMIVIPLTSNLQALRFPHTLEVKKSDANGLDEDSIAMLFQMQALDKRRFLTCIGELEHSVMKKIDDALLLLLQLQ